MGSVHQATYFCPACGAMRAKGAKRCPSCGRIFEKVYEGDITETAYTLAHPQVKAPYRPKTRLGMLFGNALTFEWIVMAVGIILIVMAIRALLPYAVGVKTEGTVTDLEAMNCQGGDCQYLVRYEFTDIQGKVHSGQYHWSYADYYFNPPEEGRPTPIKYIPYLTPLFPPVVLEGWFPWGMFLAAAVGIFCIIAAQRHWL